MASKLTEGAPSGGGNHRDKIAGDNLPVRLVISGISLAVTLDIEYVFEC